MERARPITTTTISFLDDARGNLISASEKEQKDEELEEEETVAERKEEKMMKKIHSGTKVSQAWSTGWVLGLLDSSTNWECL